MKSIKSTQDLAINGAQPAFAETLHVGSPNLGNRAALDKYIDGIYERCWVTNNGPLVQELEAKIAAHHDVQHCVAMSNGTIALEIAIRALELCGEVIVPSYTFVATAHALHWQAITPVFADIDPVTHHLDPAAVRRMITPNTTGIIGVHLWGRCAPVEELQALAQEFELKLLFDAAHAFGCSHNGAMVGRFGSCEVLSFHATKFFNTFEGGAVLTNDDALAKKMRLMRNFGFAGLDNVIHPGTNGKMNEISAAMGLVNFESLDQLTAVNQEKYELYSERLAGIPGISILPYDYTERNNFQYVVLELGQDFPVKRDELIRVLHAENIRARRYFWPGCHNMKPYRDIYPHAGLLLTNTTRVARRVVVLPTGAAVSAEAIDVIAGVVRVLAGAPV
jgi:dTDP-4-amino-4,6-dideoxygalactose transaminase